MTGTPQQRFPGRVSAGAFDTVSGGLTHDGAKAGIVYENAGAPTTNGTSGTLAGMAGPGKLLTDITNGVLYQNTGTKASPIWSLVSSPGGGLAPPLSVATGLTASTTHTLVGALALTKAINQLSTVASASDAVSLPAMQVGEWCDVYNDGVSTAAVWPSATGIAIDAGSAGASVALSAASRCRYTQFSATLIKSAKLGVVSS